MSVGAPKTPQSEHEMARRRLQVAFDLYDAAEQIMRQNLKRRHPEEPTERIEERLRQWLLSRPGAEQGDAEGVPCTVPRDRG